MLRGMFSIFQIVNCPVSSNCYVFFDDHERNCIVVDPGTEDCKELLAHLKENNLYPEYIILTHEHIDHVIGCAELKKYYNTKIICSSSCGVLMNDPKFNLIRYSEQFEGRSFYQKADICFEGESFSMNWNDRNINFYKAEGHSLGSIYFDIEDYLFVGDTIIKGYKTTTILPGASKENLMRILKNILLQYDVCSTTVLPGHFDSFLLEEVKQETEKQILFLKDKIIKQKKRND